MQGECGGEVPPYCTSSAASVPVEYVPTPAYCTVRAAATGHGGHLVGPATQTAADCNLSTTPSHLGLFACPLLPIVCMRTRMGGSPETGALLPQPAIHAAAPRPLTGPAHTKPPYETPQRLRPAQQAPTPTEAMDGRPRRPAGCRWTYYGTCLSLCSNNAHVTLLLGPQRRQRTGTPHPGECARYLCTETLDSCRYCTSLLLPVPAICFATLPPGHSLPNRGIRGADHRRQGVGDALSARCYSCRGPWVRPRHVAICPPRRSARFVFISSQLGDFFGCSLKRRDRLTKTRRSSWVVWVSTKAASIAPSQLRTRPSEARLLFIKSSFSPGTACQLDVWPESFKSLCALILFDYLFTAR